MEPEKLYSLLGRLLAEVPDFRPVPDANVARWLARASALIEQSGDSWEVVRVREAANTIMRTIVIAQREDAFKETVLIMHRALARAELKAPTAVQGAFVAAGDAFDAYNALAKVLSSARSDLLIIDPYMDEKVLTEFGALADACVHMRLLADRHSVKATLQPAVQRWITQYGNDRPLEARLAGPRTLHDRLIIVDRSDAWVLTQSLNAFASRAPASIVRSDAETAALKVAAYDDVWDVAVPIQ
jgi:hypothetical protein